MNLLLGQHNGRPGRSVRGRRTGRTIRGVTARLADLLQHLPLSPQTRIVLAGFQCPCLDELESVVSMQVVVRVIAGLGCRFELFREFLRQ